MNPRQQRIREIESALGRSTLIFFGTRGADAETLLEIDQFHRLFSQVAPLRALSVRETCLELLTKERVDLDQYNIDQDSRPVISEMRRELLDAFDSPCHILAYRPSALLASAWFPRSDRVRYHGIFHEKQACFEHKPWVETQLASLGIRVLPWSYYADEESSIVAEALRAGPVVLRANRSDGGAGVELVTKSAAFGTRSPRHADGFLAVAPFLSPSVPLNVNACVFSNGEVSMHGPSLQLIGITLATTRAFGYCGNDFARIADLDSSYIDQAEEIVVKTGRWLHSNGYLGAFGIDLLLYKGEVYLTELNPRFQGSSMVSACIDRELGRPDLFLNHLSAFLHLPAMAPLRLRELVRQQPPYAHVVCHNKSAQAVRTRNVTLHPLPTSYRLLADSDVHVQPGAITVQSVFRESVTSDGMSLRPHITRELAAITQRVFEDALGPCLDFDVRPSPS